MFTVSNALKPQRRFLITGLTPSTRYIIRMEAFSIAGSANADFPFVTLTKEGGMINFHVSIEALL